MNLLKVVNQANLSGGYRMTPARKKAIFKGDARLAKNVIQITASKAMIEAVKQGILSDHRVAEELWKAGSYASAAILKTEESLGRKLPRSRAKELVKHYLVIQSKRSGLEAAKRFISALNYHADEQTIAI